MLPANWQLAVIASFIDTESLLCLSVCRRFKMQEVSKTAHELEFSHEHDQAAMRNMQYRVMVTDRAHDLETTFTHSAPEWLFDSVENVPAYLKILSDEYHDSILRETPWRCLACDKKATELVSRPFVGCRKDRSQTG